MDRLPLALEHVYNALALDMRDREPEEHLLHPQHRPKAAMEASTVHRWFKKALERAGLSK